MSYNVITLLDDLFNRADDEFKRYVAQVSNTIGPEALPMDWRIEWEERSAIMEYDGGLTREHAESEALKDIHRQMRDVGVKIEGT